MNLYYEDQKPESKRRVQFFAEERAPESLGYFVSEDEIFRHHAFHNSARGRIEMHPVGRCAQDIRLCGRRFHFESGERIHTENSYKYSLQEFHAITRAVGLRPRQTWLDAVGLFSVHYLSAERGVSH